MKILKHFLYVVLLTLPILQACGNSSNEESNDQPAANVQVEVAKAEQGPIRQLISATGILSTLPNQDVKVSALVPGRISQIFVIEGDKVMRDQVIAKLDAFAFEDQLKQAKATLENARQNEARLESLYQRGIAAGRELEDAHKDLVIAQSAYDTAAVQLSRTQVRSPISGVVVKRFVNVGEQVDGTSNQPIEQVANFDPIEVVATLQATYLPLVKPDQDVEIKIDTTGENAYEGKVVSVLPAVDTSTNTGTVRIRLSNAKGDLRSGMFASASIITAIRNDAIYVPVAAINSSDNQPKVFVVGPDSTAQERLVKTNWRDGDKIEILSGIQKGEVVVTTGSYGLGDKMKVTVLQH